MRLINNKVLGTINNNLIDYPTPVNLNYNWSFGSLAGICFSIQLITGILLAMHYTPHTTYAFLSVEHIMRDINDGWLLRYLHSNGASMFFICVLLHMYRSDENDLDNGLLRLTGFIIFLLLMAIAFMGYILPWGQMSFWGATVITNLFAAIPYVGPSIAEWLWGGFAVDNPTLNRFFSLHYLLPFILAGLIIIHLILLHYDGSSDEQGEDSISFYPYYYVKDLFVLFLFLLIFCTLVIWFPNLLSHPDNYILANNLVTPAHLVPEWYFLPFYAILRSTPNKFGGFINMGLIIIALFDDGFDEEDFFIFLILMWLGANDITPIYMGLSNFLTFITILFTVFDEF
jgi:quinol-cytochrome oxidoreductase complex cytochrome b subunit